MNLSILNVASCATQEYTNIRSYLSAFIMPLQNAHAHAPGTSRTPRKIERLRLTLRGLTSNGKDGL